MTILLLTLALFVLAIPFALMLCVAVAIGVDVFGQRRAQARKPYDTWPLSEQDLCHLAWGRSVSPSHDERFRSDQIRRRREMSRGAM